MVIDHGTVVELEAIAISKFKATCLAVLERVRKTGQPVLITRFGHPVAEISPPSLPKAERKLGTLRGSIKIIGDIVSPASDGDDGEALHE